MELTVGKIYKCTDGEIRRLDKIEDRFLHYSMLIDISTNCVWRKLGRTFRKQVEDKFINGEIVTEQELID